ncbi:MAG: aminoacyl-tRNA hydrolase [Candidatus Omnitrophica bacterium]|nr:aminoacyl-tRNA hydrolase [Candidatus Omnitrophota bacterium]
MKLIVGLGNPGARYEETRHNIGFTIVSRLSKRWAIPLKKELCRAKVGRGTVGSDDVALALPQTMMNASGDSVEPLRRHWNISLADILVVYDDKDLPLGVVRLRPKGSDGGHKGLASVIRAVGTEEIPRLRVGIGSPDSQDTVDHVLTPFHPSEKKAMEKIAERVEEACEMWLSQGMTAAMNLFNKKEPDNQGR